MHRTVFKSGSVKSGLTAITVASVAASLLIAAGPSQAAETNISPASSELPNNAGLFVGESSNGCRQLLRGANGVGETLIACQPGSLLNASGSNVTTTTDSGSLKQLPLQFTLAKDWYQVGGEHTGPNVNKCAGTNFNPACSFQTFGFTAYTWVPSERACPYLGAPTRTPSIYGPANRYTNVDFTVRPGQVPLDYSWRGSDGSVWTIRPEFMTPTGTAVKKTATNWQRYDSTFSFSTVDRANQTLCIKTGSILNIDAVSPYNYVMYSRERRIDVVSAGQNQSAAQYRPHVPRLVAVGSTTVPRNGSWSAHTILDQLSTVSDPTAVDVRELRFRYTGAEPPATSAGYNNGGGCAAPVGTVNSTLYPIDIKRDLESRGLSPANSSTVVERVSSRLVPERAKYLCAYQYLKSYGTEYLSRSVWLELGPVLQEEDAATPALPADIPNVATMVAVLQAANSRLATYLQNPVLDEETLQRLQSEAAEAANQAAEAAGAATVQQEESGAVASPQEAEALAALTTLIEESETVQRQAAETRTPLQIATAHDFARTPIVKLGKTAPSGLKMSVKAPKSVKKGRSTTVKVVVSPKKWAGTTTVYLIKKVNSQPRLVAETTKVMGAKGGALRVTVPKTAKAGKYQLLTVFTPKSEAKDGLASFKPMVVR